MQADPNLPKAPSQVNLVDNDQLSYKKNLQSNQSDSTSSITAENDKNRDDLTPEQNESKGEDLTEAEDKPRAIVKRLITVEPTLFFTMFALALQMNPSSALIIDKICQVTFNYSKEFCKNYTSDPDAKDKIQSYSADFGMYKSLIETIPAVVYSCFLGSWSDKHSRKLPIIIPIFGFLASAICSALNVYYIETPPEYLFIGSAFIGFSGGMVSFIMGSFSYITDITTVTARTKRIAIADLALFVALPIGMTISSAMYSAWGYMPEYAISIAFFCVSIFYSIFYLSETVESVSDGRKCGVLRDLFDVQNLLDNLKILIGKRPGNDRIYIQLMLLSMFFMLFPLLGEGNIMLLFVQAKFGWDQVKLGYYTTYSFLITAVGTILVFRLIFRKYKLPDLVLGAVGLSGMCLKSAIISVSFEGWMLYVAATVSFFQFIGMPTIRSFSSKLVTTQEVGKLYAVISSCEALSPIASSVVYSQMYKATKDVYLGAVFVLSAGLVLIPSTIFIWIHLNKKKHDRYKQFEADKAIVNGEQPMPV